MQALGHFIQNIASKVPFYSSTPNLSTKVTFCDGSTLSAKEVNEISQKMELLQLGDPEHILLQSMDPTYEIPLEVAERFRTITILSEDGEFDLRFAQVIQTGELALFQIFGGNSTSGIANAYRMQAYSFLEAGNARAARESLRLYEEERINPSEGITTYRQLYYAGFASISNP